MYAQSKIHSAFSHEGKANTCEPSLAPLNLSVHSTIRIPLYAFRDLNCQALIKTKKAVAL